MSIIWTSSGGTNVEVVSIFGLNGGLRKKLAKINCDSGKLWTNRCVQAEFNTTTPLATASDYSGSGAIGFCASTSYGSVGGMLLSTEVNMLRNSDPTHGAAFWVYPVGGGLYRIQFCIGGALGGGEIGTVGFAYQTGGANFAFGAYSPVVAPNGRTHYYSPSVSLPGVLSSVYHEIRLTGGTRS